MRDDRPNREVCAEFRKLLTEGFYIVTEDGELIENMPAYLAATKPWRNELWRAFRELEDRLCPQPIPKGEKK